MPPEDPVVPLLLEGESTMNWVGAYQIHIPIGDTYPQLDERLPNSYALATLQYLMVAPLQIQIGSPATQFISSPGYVPGNGRHVTDIVHGSLRLPG